LLVGCARGWWCWLAVRGATRPTNPHLAGEDDGEVLLLGVVHLQAALQARDGILCGRRRCDVSTSALRTCQRAGPSPQLRQGGGGFTSVPPAPLTRAAPYACISELIM
jgi:hypothetical protein